MNCEEMKKTADSGCFFILFNVGFACELVLVYQDSLHQDIAMIDHDLIQRGVIVLTSFLGGLFPSLCTPPYIESVAVIRKTIQKDKQD